MMTDLGTRFRELRARKGWLTLDVAILLGHTASEISAFEIGKEPWPTETAKRISALLELYNLTE